MAGQEGAMANPVKPIPDKYHAVTPYLAVKGATAAIEFYTKAFEAKEIARFPMPDGRIGHAEIRIGDAIVMLSDESPEMGHRSPQALGGSPVQMHLYVVDVDDVVKRAVAAGAKLVRPVRDQFYGDRSGVIHDPFGHVWNIATHIEDVSPDEMQRRAAAQFGQ